jgi:hypothetical protein
MLKHQRTAWRIGNGKKNDTEGGEGLRDLD